MLHTVGPAPSILMVCWPLSSGNFLLKVLRPSGPFVQPDPVQSYSRLIQKWTLAAQQISPFFGIMT